MRILVDADGCPVVKEVVAIGREKGIEVILFCDTNHFLDSSKVKVITVSKGNDAVDFKLISAVQKGDLIITQDYGLAAMGLAKGAKPIHQNGFVYTDENIDQLLFTRHLGKEIRRKGGRTKGPSKRTKEQDAAFKRCLLQMVESGLKEEERK